MGYQINIFEEILHIASGVIVLAICSIDEIGLSLWLI